ncbi:MAG: hypothetical protein ACE5JL_10950, partial [Dehalococcoidia bacterium]
MQEVLLALRIVHILAAVVFLGGVFFYYFLLRPTLNRIPPAHAVVVNQRVGKLYAITAFTTLGLLVASGVLRLYFVGILDNALTGQFYASAYGRWFAVMIFGWLIATADTLIMTLVLRPRLLRKYPPDANPTRDEVTQRRMAQFRTSIWMDRLSLVGFASGAVAIIA